MSRDPRRFLHYLEAERKAALLYRALADTVEGDRRVALLELAEIEEQHAEHWVAKCDEYGVPVPPAPTSLDPDDATLVRKARATGLSTILKTLEETEGANAGMYDDEPDAFESMADDERVHAETFRKMNSERATAVTEAQPYLSGDGNVDFGETWHRGDRTGSVRAAVFGISDGLVSNTALVMGFAGAASEPKPVLFAGIAGLLAGAFSMAAGEYVSVASQRDLFQREINMEAQELADKPDEERKELELIYRAKGIDRESARQMADSLMADPKVALDTLAREELGLDPSELGSPTKVALSSFTAFAIGALVVVLPYVAAVLAPTVITTSVALWLAIGLSAASMIAVGSIVGRLSGKGIARSALRQLGFGAGAAAVTYVIGSLVGTTLA